jgi:outer membrane autotransporter protein
MVTRRFWLVFVTWAALAAVPTSSFAQSLDQEVTRLLNNDCLQLGVFGGNSNNPGNPLGPDLDRICVINTFVPVGSSTGGGAGSTQGSDALLTRPKAEGRVESLRDGEKGAAEQILSITDLFDVQGLGLWASGDYTRRDRDITAFEDGYESDVYGASGGVDYRFASIAFAGLAYNFQRTNGDFDGGGDFRTDSHGVAVYGSVSPVPQVFVDGSVSYAWKDYDIDRFASYTEENQTGPVDTFVTFSGIADGDTDGRELSARGVLGYDLALGALTVGPRAGVNFVHTEIDGYTERGNSGIELTYSDRTRQSLQSVVGATLSVAGSTPFGAVIPQIDAEWIHEFQDDQRHHSVRFAQDLRTNAGTFAFQNEQPDRDFFNVNAGVSIALAHGIQTFVQYRTLVGHSDFQSHGVAAGVRVELGGGS